MEEQYNCTCWCRGVQNFLVLHRNGILKQPIGSIGIFEDWCMLEDIPVNIIHLAMGHAPSDVVLRDWSEMLAQHQLLG